MKATEAMVLAMQDTRPNGLGPEEDHPSSDTTTTSATTTPTTTAGTGQPAREGCPAEHQHPDPEPAQGERIQLCYRQTGRQIVDVR